ncbi:septation ring formation regulator EzrA [Fictibacillus sp. Mic-4]|uniref:septation ring formation regulator EzrA n=1 Tax=Fictibacillus TaxID=1329200 RepID=UPI00040F3870|nr:septation ring formation regulator EzrA [Fictibacillus gelatini]
MTYAIIISCICILFVLIVVGSVLRKRIYNEIDELETWKIEIMNRPLTEEISKVKGLSMVGETEEKFEAWRNEWDEIVTVSLPNVEELLLDADDTVDRYRFTKAKGILKKVSDELDRIENRIKTIAEEIDEFITSEELNRGEIVEAKEQYNEAKKYFLKHIRSLGKTTDLFEKEFNEIYETFTEFDQQTEQGNHLEARHILVSGMERLKAVREKMEVIPELLVMLLSDLPANLKDLRDGFEEMEEQGYVLNHIVIEKEIEAMQEKIKTLLDSVYQLQTDEAQQGIDALNSEIDQLYDMLENEVVSKKYVLNEKELLAASLADIRKDLGMLREETEMVSLSYQIDESDLEMQKRLEKMYSKLQKRFMIIEQSIEDKKDSFSVIREMMEELAVQLESLKKSNVEYKEILINLRKDELHAKEKLKELRAKLHKARRMVQESNLPGLPDHYLNTLSKAEGYIHEVSKQLDEKPLDMGKVTHVLEKALEAVEEGYDETKEIIENALLAEKLIQYGNRYRSSNQTVSIRLIEAEIAFRNYRYEEALEIAASAVESVQPGITKELNIKLKQGI